MKKKKKELNILYATLANSTLICILILLMSSSIKKPAYFTWHFPNLFYSVSHFLNIYYEQVIVLGSEETLCEKTKSLSSYKRINRLRVVLPKLYLSEYHPLNVCHICMTTALLFTQKFSLNVAHCSLL